jgi:hypothetical protein
VLRSYTVTALPSPLTHTVTAHAEGRTDANLQDFPEARDEATFTRRNKCFLH